MPDERPPEEPQTLQDWLWRIKRYEKGIYVRHQNEIGKWGSASLDELTPKEWATHVARWLEEGRTPLRVREPEELGQTKERTHESTDNKGKS